MLNVEKIRVTNQAGLNLVRNSNSDLIVFIDAPAVLDTATVFFPENPFDAQMFLISCTFPITSFTYDSAGKTVKGGINTLVATGVVGWFFDAFTNTWFPYINPSSNESRYKRVSGSNATTTGQALTTVTGLQQPLLANSAYEFEAVLTCSTSAVTTGTGYGINYSAAGASIEGLIFGSLTATASKTLRINAFNTSLQPWLTTSGQSGGIIIRGNIITGANAGDLIVQHLKITSGTSTVFINSFLKTTRIA